MADWQRVTPVPRLASVLSWVAAIISVVNKQSAPPSLGINKRPASYSSEYNIMNLNVHTCSNTVFPSKDPRGCKRNFGFYCTNIIIDVVTKRPTATEVTTFTFNN